MKLKLNSVQLVCVILVQLMLIDAFLIFCFLKKLNIGNKAETEIAAVVAKKSSKNVFSETKTTKESDGAWGKEQKRVDYFAFLKDFERMFGLDKPVARDFRIRGRHSIKKSFVATAYDLSYESCGKYPNHPEYGITFSGKPAVKGRTIAVDPEVIPLESKVYIEFPKEYAFMDGWYVAEDTGSKVKGNIIDVYFGESEPLETKKFGRRSVNVQIIYPDGNIG